MDQTGSHRSGGASDPLRRWVLLTGSRTVLAGGIAVGVAALTALLVVTDAVYVGPQSNLSTVLGSGTLGALATIVTVTLSINQLILSRVFGSPADLTDRLEGNLEFRRSVEDVAGVNTSPNDPGSFLALVGSTLEERAASLDRNTESMDDLDDDAVDDFASYTAALVDYADHLATAEDSQSTFEVLVISLGTEYADQIDDTRHLQSTYGDRVPGDVADDLDASLELLKSVATIRQFFKTLAIQQDLARLSRRLIYTGVVAVLVTFYLALAYTGSGLSPTLPAAWLPAVVSVAAGVIFAPLAVLVSYLLRVATVTLYTVSVGSFIPPEERVDGP
ncbi:MAG: hypothetical protein ABEJ22_04860 [Haloferacaceae archaeon]